MLQVRTMRGGVVTVLMFMLASSTFAFFGMGKAAPTPVELQETDLVDNESCRLFMTSISGKPSYVSVRSFGNVLRKGLYACAKIIVQTASGQVAIEYKDVFEAEQRQVTNELASLKTAIESSLPMKSVSPAFQWAQSPTELLLNVKFSHKIDAPATLNVNPTLVNITEHRMVLEATDGRKLFRLEIEFQGVVVPEESTHAMASVGRMTFNIKKQGQPSRWPSLTKGNKKLPQMHFWYDAQEKYTDELAKLEENSNTVTAPATETKKPPEATASDATSESAKDGSNNGETGGDSADNDVGRIVSEEELAKRAEAKKVEEEHRKQLAALDDEARKRKKAIDALAKEQKVEIDKEVAAKKAEVEKTFSTIKGEKKSPTDEEL